MSDFRFAEPSWAALLWAVAALVAMLWWLDLRSTTALGRFLSVRMQQRLVVAPSAARRRTAIVLLGASLAFAVVALMRPQWGLQLLATPRVGAEIMVCLDVSNSMLAEDVAPNRLERAKAEIRDLLGYLRGDSVGLIAFAGRASVLAPVTPDFSFLRLVLDSAGPRSVSRGGTRLEEPIRKAVAGFRAGASVSRSIILITDGEDHDSFPLEAAKEAAEKGIRILAIGFGDEAGSPIQVTDPKTGAKRSLRDAGGQEVISRLDGDTLREIALATGGAYVPAGTGVLDLETIYDRHIASLTRGSLDGQQRAVRNEAYQWAVLASLVLLVASVVVGSGGSRPPGPRSRAAAALAVLLAVTLLGNGRAVRAEDAPAGTQGVVEAPPGDSATAGDNRDAAAGSDAAPAPAPAAEEPPKPPREVYNAALEKLAAGDLDEAATMLEDARSRAGTDAVLRRDATYDLGALDARRADAKLESAPEEALAALERSAAWFREAVSIDAQDAEARHNLELVLRRAVVVADAIARKNQKDLRADIEALMEEQRAFLAGVREALQAGAPPADANAGAHDAERERRAMRDLATRQLALSSKAEDVSERAVREQAAVRAKPADQQTPEEQMRAVQIDGVLEALHQARAQMGQARGRLRRLEGPGSYRAASTALTQLKRARDRLLDPVQVLDLLIADTLEQARLAGIKVALDSGQANVPEQKWLTPEHLADGTGELRERVEELHHNFVTVLAQNAASAQQGEDPSAAPEDPKNARLLERVQEAEPPIGEGVASLARARGELEQGRVREAIPALHEAVAKLASARESFLELQGLIDLLYSDEKRVEGVIAPQAEVPASERAEYAPMAAAIQRTNTARTPRVERALADAIVDAAEAASAAKAQAEAAQQGEAGQHGGAGQHSGAAAPAPDPAAPDPAAAAQQAQAAEAEKQKLELATTYLTAARGALDQAVRTLDALEVAAQSHGTTMTDEAWQPSQAAVAEAVARIEDLRRLFFSVIDHLKELAQREVELGDRTEETSAMASAAPDRDWTEKAGPLGASQDSLAMKAATIADALREQASQPVPPEAQGQVPADLPERLGQAATHVDSARAAMESATQSLGINPPAFADARTSQNTAVQELAAAIQLLTPPQQQQQDQQEQQDQQQGEQEQQQQQQQQGGEQQEGGASKEKGEDQETDPAQLLQGIRDREAERRAARERAEHQGYDPVEKDW